MSLKVQTQRHYFKLRKYSTSVHSHPHAAQNTVYLNGAQNIFFSRMFKLLSTIKYSKTKNATMGKFYQDVFRKFVFTLSRIRNKLFYEPD